VSKWCYKNFLRGYIECVCTQENLASVIFSDTNHAARHDYCVRHIFCSKWVLKAHNKYNTGGMSAFFKYLFYLMMLLVTQNCIALNDWMTMNNEVERM
jgi:hypothetical protein